MSNKIDKPYNPGLPEPTEKGMKLLPNAVVTSKNGQYYCCCCNHKGEKIYIPVPRSWGSLTGNIHDQKDLIELLLSITLSPADKEVFTVLTADTTAPSSPTEGDLYINTSDNKLYKYTSGSWAEDSDDTMTEAVYVAEDTGHVWTYNGSAFVDSGSNVVDDVIYVRNLTTDLESYTDNGVYTVCYAPIALSIISPKWYSMVVTGNNAGARRKHYQILQNKDGWQQRLRTDTEIHIGTWGAWEKVTYARTVVPIVSGNLLAMDENGQPVNSGKKVSDFATAAQGAKADTALQEHQDISGKADKVENATDGNFAGLDSDGNMTDSGKKSSDFATSVHTHTIADVTNLQATLDELRILAYAGL